MDLSVSERAKIVARYLSQKEKITMAKVGQKMGYTNRAAFSSVLNGLKKMPASFCDRLAALDPEINPDFLSGKTDEMLRPDNEPALFSQRAPKEQPSGIYLPLELVKLFTNMSDTIRSQQETILQLVGKKDAEASAM